MFRAFLEDDAMFKSQALKLFRKAFDPWVKASPPLQRPRPAFKPRLEPLEDRLAPATFTVINTNDDGNGSLRAAITQVNSSTDASNTINFAQGVTGTITLESALPAINNNVNMTGPGASNLTVTRDPNATTQFPIFVVNGSTTVSITGLTISGGVAPTEPFQ
jgi:hypothetical protein